MSHRSLSDISHLFLSSVREKHAGGCAPTRRKPPQASSTPAVVREPEAAPQQAEQSVPVPPVRALIASHFGARHLEVARNYARSLSAGGSRVGLIVIDAAELRVMTFEPADELGHQEEAPVTNAFDVRVIRDVISELSCDLDCWLIAPANFKLAEARQVLRDINRWVLLSGCDHDSVVASYRTLKGLGDLHHPRLSLAAVDAHDPAEADLLFRKLAGVCSQFLQWKIEPEPVVDSSSIATEYTVLNTQVAHDKAQLATPTHWGVVQELLVASKGWSEEQELNEAAPGPVAGSEPVAAATAGRIAPVAPARSAVTSGPSLTLAAAYDGPAAVEVIDLPDDATADTAILGAVMRHSMSHLVECPLRPPMCEGARLAITRERGILLIATAGKGLSQLRSIGLAYRWVVENQKLLAMAMPQFSLDSNSAPRLRLLVDQGDLDADLLQPIFQVQTVEIHTYRHVRWGQRSGLLLDAA